jgi:hypothetical protein
MVCIMQQNARVENQSGMKCNMIMNEQNDMTWYGDNINQKQKLA